MTSLFPYLVLSAFNAFLSFGLIFWFLILAPEDFAGDL